MSVDENQNKLLHLAVAAGVARHCLKFIAQGGFGECVRFSRAHLDTPAFADLQKPLRDVAEFEIFEFVKDCGMLPDGGRRLLAEVRAGAHGTCWEVANLLLETHGPGYARVEPVPIDPALLA